MTKQQVEMLTEARDKAREAVQILTSNPNGIVKRVRDLEDIMPNLLTKDDFNNRKRSRWLAVKDMVLIVLALGGMTAAFLKVFL